MPLGQRCKAQGRDGSGCRLVHATLLAWGRAPSAACCSRLPLALAGCVSRTPCRPRRAARSRSSASGREMMSSNAMSSSATSCGAGAQQ